MANHPHFTRLFFDIGGVLLTNGWDTQSRKLAAATFDFDFARFEERHRLVSDTLELGKMTLEEYLDLVLFYSPRPFSQNSFKQFMLDQSKPFPDMLRLAQEMKQKHNLKIAVVSNESRELTEYRVKAFKLNSFVDFFITSAFVGLRKPDKAIYRLALDIAQVAPEQVIYIENTPLYIDIAKELGIESILHTDYASTKQALTKLLT
jgi:putative hydrolase of the HAD superfamily